MRIMGPFVNLCKVKYFYLMIFMLLFTVISGFGVVYCKHRSRTLHIKLQQMHALRAELNVEWSKLLLEKSTWMADARVEQLAKIKLNMINPEQIYIIRQ